MPEFEHGRNDVVAVCEHIRLDEHPFADDPLDRKAAAIDLRLDILNHNARTTILGQRTGYGARGMRGRLYWGIDHCAPLRQTACLVVHEN